MSKHRDAAVYQHLHDRIESPHSRGLRLRGSLEHRSREIQMLATDMRTMIHLKADDTPVYLSQHCLGNLRDAQARIGELLAMAEEKEEADG